MLESMAAEHAPFAGVNQPEVARSRTLIIGTMTKTSINKKQNPEERVLKHWHSAVPNDRMAHLIKDATRVFLRALQMRLSRHDVQLGHWAFLRILWEQDGMTQRELSDEAGFMEPTTVIALRSMESLGYVTREHRPDNRKNLYVFLTPKGKRLKKVLIPLAEEVNQIALAGATDADVATTRRTLLSMLDNLSQDPAILDGGKEKK